MDSEPNEPSDLQETRALRRLARGLLYDPARADDVVQDAWLAELQGFRRPAWSRGAWLAGAVRRLARGAGREDARRRRREGAAAADERLPGAGDSAARLEVLRSVVDAVGALEEPYREAILLRYFDGLPPRAIAKRLGVPIETVRTRQKRGLQRLRVRLDERHRDARQSFLSALLPLTGELPWTLALGLPPGSASFIPWSGALAMSKGAFLWSAAAAALLLAVLAYRPWDAAQVRSAPTEPAAALAPPSAPPEMHAEGALAGSAAPDQRRAAGEQAALAAGDWVVHGRLSLGYRRPCPGGQVRAELFDARSTSGQSGELLRAAVLTADALGEFAWALPRPEGAVVVVARADVPGAFNDLDRKFVPAGAEPPQALQPRAYPLDSRLVGRVVDAGGAAVAGAEVSTFLGAGHTGDDGRFSLPASSVDRRVQGRAMAPGYAKTDFSVLPLAPGQLDAGDIVLPPELRARGRVLDEDGAPVEGARVAPTWAGYEGDLSFTAAHTNAQGAFELGQLCSRDWDGGLAASKAGYARCVVALPEPTEDRNPAEVEIVLAQGALIRGRVVREDGKPAAGALMRLASNPNEVFALDSYSAADGSFEIAHAPTREQTLWAILDGAVTARLPLEVPERGVLDGLVLELRPGHRLSGRVVDEQGACIPWAWIYVESSGHTHDVHVPSVTSDREGRFHLAGLPDGELIVGFLADGHARHEEHFAQLDRDDLVVQMQRTGRLAGRVLDAASGLPPETFIIRFVAPELPEGEKALDSYWVKWSSGFSFTGTDGYWNADSEQLEPGRWIGIEATASGYGVAVLPNLQTEVSPDPDAHTILLHGPSRVGGHVVEAATGLPLAGATISRITEAEPAVENSRWSTKTDTDGSFELVVPPGEMSLAVEHARCSLFVDGPFDVLPGGPLLERRIAVERGRTLAGLLLAPGGEPLPGETVELRALEVAGGRQRQLETATDAQGGFVFEDLGAGLYHLGWIETRGDIRCQRMIQLVELTEGEQPQQVRLQPQGAAALRGTLRGRDLSELQVVQVFPHENSAGRMAKSGDHSWAGLAFGAIAEGGSFVVEGLEPGLYTVSVWVSPGRPGARNGWAVADVPAGGAADVVVEIPDLPDPNRSR